MDVIADICIIPLGVGVSVSNEIAVCERIFAEAGLSTTLHAYGTNVEGEWDRVFAAVKRCHEALHAAGVPRISPQTCASCLLRAASHRLWICRA